MKKRSACTRIGLAVMLWMSVCMVASWPSSPSRAQALAPLREYEPVVMEGRQFANWVGVADIGTIVLYRWDGATWTPIPYQIDKRRLIDLLWNLDPGQRLGQPHICEYGYFPELSRPGGGLGNFASDLLQATDEVVFMLKDAGSVRADTLTWFSPGPGGVVDTIRYEIIVRDGLTLAPRYLYAYRWTVGSPVRSTLDYVAYTRDADGTPECPPEALACGTAESRHADFNAGPADPLPTLSVHFRGNWTTNGYQVKRQADGQPELDMLRRLHYFTPGETESDWNNTGFPHFLGVKPVGDPTVTVAAPVRVIRAVQGAMSGQGTTKYEFIYPTQFVTRANMRVHPLPYLKAWVNHVAGFADDKQPPVSRPGYVWTRTSYSTNGTPLNDIDGVCQGLSCELLLSGEPHDDWTEVASENRGSYVQIKREQRLRPIPAETRKYQFNEDAAFGWYGEHGREWHAIGNTQDGVENDGGCGPTYGPEAPELHFARFEMVMTAQETLLQGQAANPANIKAGLLQDNEDWPAYPVAKGQTYGPPPPSPIAPCRPPIEPVTNNGDGSTSGSIGDCSPAPDQMFYRLYRATGAGPVVFLRDLGTAKTFVDHTTRHNRTYRYAVAAYNADNVEGTKSEERIVTVVDSTPPRVPSGLVVLPGDHSATLNWDSNFERDLRGYNVYIATAPGGPYTRLNETPVDAWLPQQWVQLGLQNGRSYYFVVTALDMPRNVSGYSSEVVVVPGP